MNSSPEKRIVLVPATTSSGSGSSAAVRRYRLGRTARRWQGLAPAGGVASAAR